MEAEYRIAACEREAERQGLDRLTPGFWEAGERWIAAQRWRWGPFESEPRAPTPEPFSDPQGDGRIPLLECSPLGLQERELLLAFEYPSLGRVGLVGNLGEEPARLDHALDRRYGGINVLDRSGIDLVSPVSCGVVHPRVVL
jgi:hypothetical protein